LGLAWLPATCNDFVHRKEGGGFSQLMKHLFQELDLAKHQRFDLCSDHTASPVFSEYLAEIGESGICTITEWGAATAQEGALSVSPLAADQIRLGDLVAGKCERLAITRDPLKGEASGLRLPLFGYHLHFTTSEEESGKFGPQVGNGNLRRLFDFSLPDSATEPLWNGYARRAINGYVPVFSKEDTYAVERYIRHKDFEEPVVGQPKLFDHLACEDRRPGSTDSRWVGAEGLGILKGDVDNLGTVFQKGLESPTFAKMAALSRQINAFFSIYLPWLCKSRYPNTYTVFAGGDDFFLIGPWHSIGKLAVELRQDFSRFVAGNPQLHFSAGIAITKSGLSVPQLSRLAEDALEHAKSLEGKNGVHLMGQTMGWEQFRGLSQACEALDQLRDDAHLSTGFIYGLLELARMAADGVSPEAARWRSLLNYRSWRHLEKLINAKKIPRDRQAPLHQRTVRDIGENGIQKFRAAYQVAVTTHLYLNRD
jgi:CRISPR-associated protein Csm1